MYICNRFFLCMKILRGKKRFFCKDSLVVFTHKFVNLGRKAPLVKGWPFFKHTIMTFPAGETFSNQLWLWNHFRQYSFPLSSGFLCSGSFRFRLFGWILLGLR